MDRQAYDSMMVRGFPPPHLSTAGRWGTRKKEKVRARADLFYFSSYIQNSRLEEIKIGEVAVEVVWNQWENFGKD